MFECVCMYMCVHVSVCIYMYVYVIDIKKMDKQLTHAMHVKDRYVNGTNRFYR